MRYLVAGIGTEVGKTVVSAILVKMLEADYWKPIQAGDLEGTDSLTIQSLVQPFLGSCHSEAYRFKTPVSPHLAAQLDEIKINPALIQMPETKRPLIIEMAGGVLSPLTNELTQCDLFSSWDCEWIVVSKNYLGSINHTLLTLSYMKQKKLRIKGLIFNGEKQEASEQFILNYAQIACLGRIYQEKEINFTTIDRYAKEWMHNFPI